MKRTSTAPRLVPSITSLEGEYGGLESDLTLSMNAFEPVRLAHQNETPNVPAAHRPAADCCSRSASQARCWQ
ncbi:hypothetical protein ACFVXE_35650 [Streptomyces sp. NPDC058231]|uniref:hypothetical protein n=1 Tax=Streptomyces sp. NPDC058231 TaxID=3346392 RepID=UPI0036E38815